MVQAMPETSLWYCLPLQSSKAYSDHSKTLVNREGCHGCHCEIWGSRIGGNEESSLLGREAAKRFWFSRIYLYINTNVWVNWTDGDKGKGKAVPLKAWTGPEGSRKLRLPDFVTTAQGGGKFVILSHRPHLPLRKYSWYSFLLEVKSTPVP